MEHRRTHYFITLYNVERSTFSDAATAEGLSPPSISFFACFTWASVSAGGRPIRTPRFRATFKPA